MVRFLLVMILFYAPAVLVFTLTDSLPLIFGVLLLLAPIQALAAKRLVERPATKGEPTAMKP